MSSQDVPALVEALNAAARRVPADWRELVALAWDAAAALVAEGERADRAEAEIERWRSSDGSWKHLTAERDQLQQAVEALRVEYQAAAKRHADAEPISEDGLRAAIYAQRTMQAIADDLAAALE
jgi:hypothetical protein